MEKEKKYRLFVGKTFDVPEDVEFSFCNAEFGYTLIFSDESKIDGYNVVPDKIMHTLSPEERGWLLRAKNVIMRRHMKSNKGEISDFMNQFLLLFEEELKKSEKGESDGEK